MIDVCELEPRLEGVYEDFVRSHPAGLVYYSVAYRNLIESQVNASPRYLLAQRDGAVRGVLPLFEADGRFGTVWNALPFFGSHGGPLAVDEEAERALLQTYDELTGAAGVASATMIENPLVSEAPAVSHDLCDLRIGQFTSLDVRPPFRPALMDAFHSKTRNMIRKAEKEGVVVARDAGAVSFLQQVHAENMAAKGGQAKSETFFRTLTGLFKAEEEYDVYIGSIDGEPVAALLLLYYNGVVEYFTPVIRVEHRSSQPLSLIILQAMMEAAARGFRLWNWGGTWPSQESLHRFKKRWGTEDRPYRYFVRIRNDELRGASPNELLDAYPYMYVLPFSKLESPAVA